ncbi:MAG: M1 family metallopeptidase [Spirochaetes bacterium]|nr:M1 family metallopeptidase [Spirochaetota bacterium]
MRRILALCAVVVLLAGGCGKRAAAGPVAAAPSQRSAIRLDLAVAADLSAVEGSMDLQLVNQEREPVDRVRFLLFPGLVGGRMDITGCTVDGAAATLGGGKRDAVRAVVLQRALAPGASVEIALSWRAAVPAIEGGGPLARTDGFASLAWCFPVALSPLTVAGQPAPYADFLCTDAASWRVRVSLPAGLVLVTGGREISRTGEDGRTVVNLELDPARDFYLAIGTGLSVRAARPSVGGGPAIRCFAPPGREAAAAFAMDVAGRAIAAFARRFGPYPYDTFTVLAGPLASLGIEFPGLTVIGARIFSLEGSMDGTPTQAVLESTIAHEVAHQWFYNLVGNDQAIEPWLDESVAQYATRLYYLDRYGEDAADSCVDSWWARWNRVDRTLTPIGLPVSAYTAKEYGAIVYGRGPLFLETLASSMGGSVFDRFLRDYVERFTWRIARGADFRITAKEQCGCDLDALFAAWVDAR